MRHFLGLIGLASMLFLSACGGAASYTIEGQPPMLGLDGQVVVEPIEGGVNLVRVRLNNLPAPRAVNNAQYYVMWFVPGSGQAVCGGALRYDPGSRTADARATTPFDTFELRITAEATETAGTPSPNVVAQRRIPR